MEKFTRQQFKSCNAVSTSSTDLDSYFILYNQAIAKLFYRDKIYLSASVVVEKS